MENNSEQQLSALFGALADPTRRAILKRLAHQAMPVNELSAPFDLSKPAISKHLKVLEKAGVLNRRIEGREHVCSLNLQPLDEVQRWLKFYDQFWNKKLDALGDFLGDES